MRKLLLTLLIIGLLCIPAYGADRVVLVDGAGEALVDATNNAVKTVGAGTAGSAVGGVVTVQGVASMTNLLTSINAHATSTTTAINAVTLDDDPTLIASGAITISEYQRVGIFWTYDETEVGGGVSGALTVTVSPDGTNYFSAPFFDTAGGATPQTTESLTADGNYIAWLDKNIPFAYMKVTITGTGTDADDTILTNVYVYMDK